MKLGVCYYPEHWPQSMWAEDAAKMKAAGLDYVRIGEFAWQRIEPAPGEWQWQWLDDAIEVLHAQGLSIVLGTPTATPPKWLVDQMPDMIALDEQGRPRGFGSRRHYCFSHAGYRAESARITTALAKRYGQHPAVKVWQTDNEFGCHNTTYSYSESAMIAFRRWLQKKYQTIDALNDAWGNVFWSMAYRSFDEIELPNLTVTEANPSHQLDFRRFSSDQVRHFNAAQVAIIREHSPGRDIHHNYMGFYTKFDHFDVGTELDIATWDSYPLGFLEQSWHSDATKNEYLRQGHPDFAGFHHDLYRAVGRGRMWVQEQQPGPVNWAPNNPSPLDGMVRLWTWEGFAHGAEVMNYFRWRQAPFAQEQMHAGLNLPNGDSDQGYLEAQQVNRELSELSPYIARNERTNKQADVALVFDYPSNWMIDIQPQGEGFQYLPHVMHWYSALRKLGLSVDLISQDQLQPGYAMVILPAVMSVKPALAEALEGYQGTVIFGPRTGSKTDTYQIPADLPPSNCQLSIPVKVRRVEGLRPGFVDRVATPSGDLQIQYWREQLISNCAATLADKQGNKIAVQSENKHYLGAWLVLEDLMNWLEQRAQEQGLVTQRLAKGLRQRDWGRLRFIFNYGQSIREVSECEGYERILGTSQLAPADLSVWWRSADE